MTLGVPRERPTAAFTVQEENQMSESVETVLTPELAAQLLAKRHPKQRRSARSTVAEYTRRIKEGRWRLIPDPIMVDPDGQMFNGGHRCEAVIAANQAIPVYIMWNADPDLFDLIDVGRLRSAFQFISAKDATERASGARVTLWYQRRFDRPLMAQHTGFDLHELLTEAERMADTFDAVMPAVRALYDYTSIARSVSTGAFGLAHEMGYHDEIEAFVEGIRDPHFLPTNDPARLLAERFRKQDHRGRRRQQVDDWTLLVYAFNLQLEGASIGKLILSDVWPRIAEPVAEYRRRQAAVHASRAATRSDLQGAVDKKKRRSA